MPWVVTTSPLQDHSAHTGLMVMVLELYQSWSSPAFCNPVASQENHPWNSYFTYWVPSQLTFLCNLFRAKSPFLFFQLVIMKKTLTLHILYGSDCTSTESVTMKPWNQREGSCTRSRNCCSLWWFQGHSGLWQQQSREGPSVLLLRPSHRFWGCCFPSRVLTVNPEAGNYNS